jgi:NAD(P)-dependent dehydrogenase (short-subunit alcohol dehydrogenase family)
MMTTTIGTVLVTGAGQRLGAAIARDFGAQGWAVAVHCRSSKTAAETVVQEIRAAGGRADVVVADLADHAAVERLLPEIAERMGPVTCVINNASIFVYDDLATLDAAQWDQHQAVNLRAPVFLAKALAAALPKTARGSVINIIDQRVWKPTPHFMSYSASKSGLWAVTQTLAQALAPHIRVNAIGPGPMLRSVHQSAEDFAAQSRAVPLQHGTTPDEICAAIRFILASPAMTGQMLALDGGQHLAWQTPDIGDGRG